MAWLTPLRAGGATVSASRGSELSRLSAALRMVDCTPGPSLEAGWDGFIASGFMLMPTNLVKVCCRREHFW